MMCRDRVFIVVPVDSDPRAIAVVAAVVPASLSATIDDVEEVDDDDDEEDEDDDDDGVAMDDGLTFVVDAVVVPSPLPQ